jgi:glycosyltransferase involved in cell wall biosynthesis
VTDDTDRPVGLPLLHRAWRLLPRDARRAALHRAATFAAPRPDRIPPHAMPGLAIAGELDRPSGLGEGARLLLHALEQLGLPTYPIRPGDRPAPPGVPLLVVGTAPSLPLHLRRLGRIHLRGRMIIGHWSWELPVVPASWHDGLRFVHRLWAPSEFTATALRAMGRDVTVVLHPVAARPPMPSPLGRDAFGLPEDAVVTLVMFNLGSSFERKNPLAAVAAHRLAFADRADRILLLHVGNPHHFPADFARLQAVSGGNVRLHTRDLSRPDSHALLACSDIVLSLHRSEGFGLVPAEAMLLGKPVVATDWSATSEFLDSSCGSPVPATLVPARDPRGVFEAPGAVWADPDVPSAASWLTRLADDGDLRHQLGTAARRTASDRLGPAMLNAAVAALGAPSSK